MVDKAPDEASLLSRYRLRIAVALFVAILVYLAADIFELPFLRQDFQAEPAVLGLLIGALSVLLGVEFINRLPGIGKNGS